LKAFSFVHAADLHLGYSQYGLEARREDFDRVFRELVDKTLALKPDFMIIAGDLFHQARPSNVTLENAIRNFKRLGDAGIPVLTVDGSHDSAPNLITSTILNPLDSTGLIYHLPRHEGACWRKQDCCYVYPGVKPPYMEAEAPPELIPEAFEYYAGGHVHKVYSDSFKSGLLVYSGCIETVDYEEARLRKGFFHVKVDEKGKASPEFIELESPRRFVILEQDFQGMSPVKITEMAVQLVRRADEDGVIIVPVLKGTLPAEANRSNVDIVQIRSAAEKALLVHPVVLLRESEVSEEMVRSIFDSEFKDLRTKSFEYFVQILSERYGREEAERISCAAVGLVELLVKKEEGKVKQALEGLLQ
jgi:DNA repair exonuclease SbcCD nuclease subunit